MSVFIVFEIVDGNEGNPGLWAFTRESDALDKVAELQEENGEDNEEVLVDCQEIPVDA